MSLSNSGEKCAVCNAYLFEEDDVVYCPECGAPHHRDCYSAIGHCVLQEFHGTDKQYKKPEPVKQEENREAQPVQTSIITCGMCGEKYETTEDVCPNCNAPNISKMGGRFVTFDFLGGVPANTDLGNGVTANEAKMFVRTNTHRYIPKFADFKRGRKVSWNWFAFLMPCAWLMSRKMYLLGSIVGALQIAILMIAMPFINALNQLESSNTVNYYMDMMNVFENVSLVGVVAFYLFIAIMVLMGLFGDRIYRRHVINTVNEIKTSDADREEAFHQKGGVSLVIGMLVQYLLLIIYTFIGV